MAIGAIQGGLSASFVKPRARARPGFTYYSRCLDSCAMLVSALVATVALPAAGADTQIEWAARRQMQWGGATKPRGASSSNAVHPTTVAQDHGTGAVMQLRGYLSDRYCWDLPGSVAIDGAALRTAPELHTVHCMRLPRCRNSGFVLLQRDARGSDEYTATFRLDAGGNELARRVLDSTTTVANLFVEINGTAVQDDGGSPPLLATHSLSESAWQSTCPTQVPGASGNVYYLHGAWMACSWSTVVAAGVYIARYCRAHHWWIHWHIRLMTLGAFGTLSFVGVAAAMVHHQLNGTHQKLGACMGMAMAIQASSGTFVHSFSSAESRHHASIKLLHVLSGKALLCVGVAQMWLGFELLFISSVLRAVWATWLLVVFVTFARAEYCKQTAAAAGSTLPEIDGGPQGRAVGSGQPHAKAGAKHGAAAGHVMGAMAGSTILSTQTVKGESFASAAGAFLGEWRARRCVDLRGMATDGADPVEERKREQTDAAAAAAVREWMTQEQGLSSQLARAACNALESAQIPSAEWLEMLQSVQQEGRLDDLVAMLAPRSGILAEIAAPASSWTGSNGGAGKEDSDECDDM